MANNIILPFSELQAELNDEAMIDPDAIIEITENGRYNVARYGYADVNVEGGGGETWQTVFEGSVTTASEVEETPWAELSEVADLSADTIKVTFNGVEYTCEKQSTLGGYSYGAPFGNEDWSEYPFRIDINPRMSSIMTQTAGTYTLKIEEPQSGGSSDFSTAEVTVTKSAGKNLCMPYIINSEQGSIIPFVASSGEYTAVLYKGLCLAMAIDMDDTSSEPTVAVTGNATADGSEITITGDCTITIS